MEIITSKKKLGFGLMSLPLIDANDDGSIDLEKTKKMVTYFWKEVLLILIRHGCIVT